MKRYFVIADSTEARIFSIADADRSFNLVRELRHPKSRLRSQEINSDQPGRLRKGKASRTRSAMEPRTDAHINQISQFAKQVGDVLQSAYDQGHFDDLAIVAPPRFLGLLRKEIEGHGVKCLRTCIARNCTHVAMHDLANQIGDSVPCWIGDSLQRVAADRSPNRW